MENQNIEYKLFVDTKDKKSKRNFIYEVIAFLNSYNGKIYIGIDDNGVTQGIESNIDIDKYLLELKDIIKNNIMPYTDWTV